MTDDRNLSTEYQPEGHAARPKDTLDRDEAPPSPDRPQSEKAPPENRP